MRAVMESERCDVKVAFVLYLESAVAMRHCQWPVCMLTAELFNRDIEMRTSVAVASRFLQPPLVFAQCLGVQA